jgi:arginine N-succinyltransferase
MSVQRDNIRTLRESRMLRIEPASRPLSGRRALIATPSIQNYRCVSAHADIANGAVQTDAAALTALALGAGADVRVWIDDAP